MKLIAFTLKNYRSIRRSHRLVFGKNLTTLIGPNNEGKSNILRALVAALRVITWFADKYSSTQGEGRRVRTNFATTRRLHNWELDFPLSLQESDPNGSTLFVIEFQPSPTEARRLGTALGRNVEGVLAFSIRCSAAELTLSVSDHNTPSIASKYVKALCDLVSQTIAPQYIPSIRTAESAQEIVNEIIGAEFRALRSKKQYRDAVNAIVAIETPVLEKLSAAVTSTLSEFLPTVKRVRLKRSATEFQEALQEACKIIVDDGTETDLKQKGDGIQSLAAMSLMRHSAVRGAGRRRIILAVEEPETHLHSKAIHQLKKVLSEIAAKNQVIITTHNPVFVNREQIETNILVTDNNATPAETTAQIRDVLGVRPSDNLRHAEIVLVVEGEDDRIAIEALLKHYSAPLRAAIANGALAIDPLYGSSNLTYKLSLIRAALCAAFVFVDFDEAGKSAAAKAIADGVLAKADVKYAMCRGKVESELEDLYEVSFCQPIVKATFGVDLIKALMRGRSKWSQRVGECFQRQGQVWDDATKSAVKAKLAAAVVASPRHALRKSTRAPFDALVKILEERIGILLDRKP
jgi:putative ATP-dependent endonuclease of the OLD family